jgi:4-amino-4-deoxy-L-arabinose transferase-like glycosyltransferase
MLHPRSLSRRWLIALLVVALAIRVAWAWQQPAGDRDALRALPDQIEYYDLARSLADGRTMHFADPRFGQDVYAYRTPGYPSFLAITGPDLRAARLLQAIVDTSTVLAAYLLARRWLAVGPSLLAGALVAFNPFLVYFTGLLLSETLFTALLTWGAAGLAWGWGPGRARGVAWAGAVCLALSAIVRPSALLLALALPLVTPVGWRRRLALLGGATAMLFCLFTPWAMRNERLLGRPVVATTNGGITLYDGFNPAATGASDQSFVGRMPELQAMNEVERSDYLESLGWRFIAERPAEAMRLASVKLARTWSPAPLSAEFGRPMYRLIGIAYAGPLYLLVIIGLWRRGLPWGAVLFLLTPAIYFSLVHVMSVGSLRYRVPVEPLLCVIAAAAVVVARSGPSPDTPEAR